MESLIYKGLVFSYHGDGYYNNRKVGKLHRFIWETEMICSLLPGIVVHHKDYNPTNNDLSNLEPMTRAEHSKLHHKYKRMSEEAKAKMSEYQSNKVANGWVSPMKGTILSDEEKLQISINTKKGMTSEVCKKISEAKKGKPSPKKIIPTQEMIDDSILLNCRDWVSKHSMSRSYYQCLRATQDTTRMVKTPTTDEMLVDLQAGISRTKFEAKYKTSMPWRNYHK